MPSDTHASPYPLPFICRPRAHPLYRIYLDLRTTPFGPIEWEVGIRLGSQNRGQDGGFWRCGGGVMRAVSHV